MNNREENELIFLTRLMSGTSVDEMPRLDAAENFRVWLWKNDPGNT